VACLIDRVLKIAVAFSEQELRLIFDIHWKVDLEPAAPAFDLHEIRDKAFDFVHVGTHSVD